MFEYRVQEKPYGERKDVTITQCLEVLRQSEAVDVTMKHFGEEGQINTSYRASDPTRRSQKNGTKNRKPSQARSPGKFHQNLCVWCGNEGRHPREKCPAKNAQCSFCKRMATLKKHVF